MDHFDSSLLLPLSAFLVAIVAIVSGVLGNAHQRRLKAEQRMAMLQRGMAVGDIERLIGAMDQPDTPRDPLRRMGNTRIWASVLIAFGAGSILFFIMVSIIVREHEVLAGAAASLVPLAIGIGLAVDYRLQARDVARLGLDVPAIEPPDRLR